MISRDRRSLPCDHGHIFAQRQTGLHLINRDPSGIQCIIRRDRLSRLPIALNHDENEMMPQVAFLGMIMGIQRCDDALRDCGDAGFLKQFPLGRSEQRFAEFNLSTRKAPQPRVGRICSLNQKHLIVAHDDRKDCNDGMKRCGRIRFRHTSPVCRKHSHAPKNPDWQVV